MDGSQRKFGSPVEVSPRSNRRLQKQQQQRNSHHQVVTNPRHTTSAISQSKSEREHLLQTEYQSRSLSNSKNIASMIVSQKVLAAPQLVNERLQRGIRSRASEYKPVVTGRVPLAHHRRNASEQSAGVGAGMLLGTVGGMQIESGRAEAAQSATMDVRVQQQPLERFLATGSHTENLDQGVTIRT